MILVANSPRSSCDCSTAVQHCSHYVHRGIVIMAREGLYMHVEHQVKCATLIRGNIRAHRRSSQKFRCYIVILHAT